MFSFKIIFKKLGGVFLFVMKLHKMGITFDHIAKETSQKCVDPELDQALKMNHF